ncbi:MAG: hypothetical protein A4S09_06825 [Proteobacteria bacterium SG_bin7]|nr:MAG: hypothetical protein A4S09_06825 [Proteobacteria bacterium SG_bin7]
MGLAAMILPWQHCAERGISLYSLSSSTSCNQIKTRNPQAATGIFAIDPDSDGSTSEVYCDMSFDGGGWTLCGVLGHKKKGTGVADGFEYSWKKWNSGSNVFMDSNQNIIGYGNFCPGLSVNQIRAESRSGIQPSTTTLSTGIINVSNGNPFVQNSSSRIVGSNGVFAINNRIGYSRGFFGGANCTALNNNIDQGSNICISDNTKHQNMIGNFNAGADGIADHMCVFNVDCAQQNQGASNIILIYVR